MVRAAIYIFCLVIFMTGYVRYIENSKIFFPAQKLSATPSQIGIKFDDVYFHTPDKVSLNGWFIPKAGARYTVLFLHGNGGNIGDRLDKIKIFYDIGVNIFIVDYRGYGRSKGRISEKGFYVDAQSCYNYLVNNLKIEPNRILVYGESLGGAAAIDLASKVAAAGLIIEGAFTSIKELGKTVHPFLTIFLLSDKFNSLTKIHQITSPKLFIHSSGDELVPFGLGQKLYKKAAPPKQLVELAGDHNNAFIESRGKYIGEIKKFIDNL